MNDNEITEIVGWPTEPEMVKFRAVAIAAVAAERAARAETYTGGNPLGGPATMFEAIARRLRAGEDYQAVMDDYGIRFETVECE